ncbi:MAG: aldehyde dehydrogenase family protein [Bdellovibrionales bacterium]
MPVITKLNPWTQEPLTEVPQMGAADFIQALQKVKQAQEIFKKTSFEQRADLLRTWAEHVANSQGLAALRIAEEQGLPVDFVRPEVVDAAQKFIENLSLELRLFPKPENLLPTGVLGVSIPWPMSYLYLSHVISQALAAGNGVIVKVSSLAPRSAQLLSETLSHAGVPEGLVQFLYGSGEELNPLLAGHPGLRAFLYQGHYRHSARLLEAALPTRKKLQFFLGGKNSSLIHPDFDFQSQIQNVLRPALMGQGQLGVNGHRFFVTQAHESQFFEVVIETLKQMKVSRGPEDSSLWTPLISKSRKANFLKLREQVASDQGKLVWGADEDEGLFAKPLVTRDMSNCSELQQEEVQGPLLIVTGVKYVHEMVKWTNTGYHGQSCLFWGPQEKAQGLLSQIQVGQGLNQRWGDFLSWQTPVKQSFYGIPDRKWSGPFYSEVKSQ